MQAHLHHYTEYMEEEMLQDSIHCVQELTGDIIYHLFILFSLIFLLSFRLILYCYAELSFSYLTQNINKHNLILGINK